MVFFVHHQAQPVPEDNRGSAAKWMRGVQTGEFLADKVPLVEQRTVGGRQLIDPIGHRAAQRGDGRHGLSDL